MNDDLSNLNGDRLLLAVEGYETEFYRFIFSFPSLDENSKIEEIEQSLKKNRKLFQEVSEIYTQVLQAPGGRISSGSLDTKFKEDSIKKLETIKEDVTLAINYLLQIVSRINNQTQMQISHIALKISRVSLIISLLAIVISIVFNFV